MNVKNLEFLQNQIKFAGFGETLTEELKQNLKAGKAEFVLFHQSAIQGNNMVAALNFTRSEASDYYFFNRYTLTMKKEERLEPLRQTFYVGKGEHNITLKEAYNLLDGRSVFKEHLENKHGEMYSSWIRLNTERLTANGNYKLDYIGDRSVLDVARMIEAVPVKGYDNPEQRLQLVKSLERGNMQLVTVVANGDEQKAFLQADPAQRAIKQTVAPDPPRIHIVSEQGNAQVQKQESVNEGEKKTSMKNSMASEPKSSKRNKGQKL